MVLDSSSFFKITAEAEGDYPQGKGKANFPSEKTAKMNTNGSGGVEAAMGVRKRRGLCDLKE